MSYVTINELQKYSNVFSDNSELQQSYIDSAESIIESYLGYSPVDKIFSPITCLFEPIIETPEIIKLTVLRIAALLQSESDSNIGVTSKTFGDSGNRTFINTVNFEKYLQPISQYKEIRI